MAEEELKGEIDRLPAENERLKRQCTRSVSMKVSEKGPLSVYGLGWFPVTLYKEQWKKLLSAADEIRTFLEKNDKLLESRGTTQTTPGN